VVLEQTAQVMAATVATLSFLALQVQAAAAAALEIHEAV
jgi:hypothetical protein